jgi:hypothetical protein
MVQQEFVKSVFGPYPQGIGRFIIKEGIDEIYAPNMVGIYVPKVYPYKFFGMFVQDIQTIAGPDPQPSLLILGDGVYPIVTDGIGVIKNGPIGGKGMPIISVESVYGPKPKKTVTILEYFGTGTAGDTFGGGKILEFKIGVLGLNAYKNMQKEKKQPGLHNDPFHNHEVVLVNLGIIIWYCY